LVSRAIVAEDLGHDREAAADLDRAAAIGAEVQRQNPLGVAPIHQARAWLFLHHGQIAAAKEQFAKCVGAFEGLPHTRKTACAVGAAFAAALTVGGAAPVAKLDRLIAEQRSRHARELPTALWLRARLAAEHVTDDSRTQQLAWLDEGAALLDDAGRGGTRVRREIESARRALGAPAREAAATAGAELVRAASPLVAAARAP
jgi:hypothetical protein